MVVGSRTSSWANWTRNWWGCSLHLHNAPIVPTTQFRYNPYVCIYIAGVVACNSDHLNGIISDALDVPIAAMSWVWEHFFFFHILHTVLEIPNWWINIIKLSINRVKFLIWLVLFSPTRDYKSNKYSSVLCNMPQPFRRAICRMQTHKKSATLEPPGKERK